MPYSKELKEAIEKEIKRPATNTHDAMLLNMLKSDYEHGLEDTSRIDYVKRKYKIKV